MFTFFLLSRLSPKKQKKMWIVAGLEVQRHLNGSEVVLTSGDDEKDDRVSVAMVADSTIRFRIKRGNLQSATCPEVTYQDFVKALEVTASHPDTRLQSFVQQIKQRNFEDAMQTASEFCRSQISQPVEPDDALSVAPLV